MVLKCVLTRCEKKWERLGWGFWLDGKKWANASNADDIFLTSATKRDWEHLIRDVALELQSVGLGLVANKTHWSSYPAEPGETLRVDEERIPWEPVLIFGGMALDQIGSSWAAIRHRLAQGTVALRKWVRLSGKMDVRCTKDAVDGCFSVSKRAVEKCAVDPDDSNGKGTVASWTARATSSILCIW